MLCRWIKNNTVKIDPDRPFKDLSGSILYEHFGWDLNDEEQLHCSFFLWEIAHISTKSLSNCDISLQLSTNRWVLTFFSLHWEQLLMKCTHIDFGLTTIFEYLNFVFCFKWHSTYAQLPYIHPRTSHKIWTMSCEETSDIVAEVQPDVSQSYNVQLKCSFIRHWQPFQRVLHNF